MCEAKDGFASDEFSSRNWNANCAGRLLKPLACNLTLAFQRDRSAIRGEQLQTVRLPRRSILCIPGSVVRLARGWTLRLAVAIGLTASARVCEDALHALTCRHAHRP